MIAKTLSRRAGVTLVELLTALAIGSLVILMVALAHRALTLHTTRQSETQRTRAHAAATIRTLSDDLQQLFVPVGDPDGALELINSATNLIRLSFLRWVHTGGGSWTQTVSRLERVTYEPSTESSRTGLTVVRQTLSGPDVLAPPVTNATDATWPSLLVHLHDGTQWQTNWMPGQAERPVAARLRLLGSGTSSEAEDTLVVIPFGLTATSTVIRAENPPPANPPPDGSPPS